jgi:uncharacterized protein YigE (DUF2233 family)
MRIPYMIYSSLLIVSMAFGCQYLHPAEGDTAAGKIKTADDCRTLFHANEKLRSGLEDASEEYFSLALKPEIKSETIDINDHKNCQTEHFALVNNLNYIRTNNDLINNVLGYMLAEINEKSAGYHAAPVPPVSRIEYEDTESLKECGDELEKLSARYNAEIDSFNYLQKGYLAEREKLDEFEALLLDTVFPKAKKGIVDYNAYYQQLQNRGKVAFNLTALFKASTDRTNKAHELLKQKYTPVPVIDMSAQLGAAEVKDKKGNSYTTYVADLKAESVRIHISDKKNSKYTSFGNLVKDLDKKGREVKMVMNAGIFQANQEPLGLLIDSFTEKGLLNLTDPNDDNFFLKPNGVFYITDKDEAAIDTTEAFHEKFKTKEAAATIKYGTQSGPQLLINGKVHRSFTKGSRNGNIRNGVGIISPTKVVFIISNGRVNLHDFASFFKDVYKCKNALYLDGAISLMYAPPVRKDLGGEFSGMISVTTDKPAKPGK